MDTTKPIEKVTYGNTEIPLKTLNLQTKEVEPQTISQTITPDEEYGGLSEVDVAAVTADIDENIQPQNIKVGVSILGVDGSLEPDKPDQTKTVTPSEQTQEVVADAGYELAKAIVNPIPSNYKNTNNATATASDILAGKVAVNQNGDVTGNIQTYSGAKSITPSASQQTFNTNGKYLDDDLVVNATPTETKTPTIDFTGVTSVDVEPTSGKFLSKVTIERPEDFVAANIRTGKTLFGIAGNLEPDKPDQTKTVTPTASAQVVEPDTGYELASVTVNAVPTEQKTVKSTTSSQTITPTSGKFIDEVTVSPMVLQSKTATPTTSQQTITPDNDKDGLASVVVNEIPSNYKDTTNADATASDILAGKTAVNQNGDVAGSIQTYAGTTNVTSNQTLATAGTYVSSNIVVNVSSDNPLIATTDAEMTALLISANNGKVVKFTGTSSTYTTDKYYLIKESV